MEARKKSQRGRERVPWGAGHLKALEVGGSRSCGAQRVWLPTRTRTHSPELGMDVPRGHGPYTRVRLQ